MLHMNFPQRLHLLSESIKLFPQKLALVSVHFVKPSQNLIDVVIKGRVVILVSELSQYFLNVLSIKDVLSLDRFELVDLLVLN